MIKLYSPRDEAELTVLKSLLDAEGIAYFVHNDHFGSLEPGPSIYLYNAKTIFVEESDLNQARDVIAQLVEAQDSRVRSAHRYSWLDKLRMFLEVLLFGWMIPGTRRRKRNVETEDDPVDNQGAAGGRGTAARTPERPR